MDEFVRAFFRASASCCSKHTGNQPYIFLFHYIVESAIYEALERGASSPIELILDEQEVFKPAVLAACADILTIEDGPRRAVLPAMPAFRDDLRFVALQASDPNRRDDAD